MAPVIRFNQVFEFEFIFHIRDSNERDTPSFKSSNIEQIRL